MSKTKFTVVGDSAVEMQAESRKWANSHGTYIAGRAYVDEADYLAAQMESKWGADRLRLMVAPELREKFDRQRYLFNQAIWHGELEEVRNQSQRMCRAWYALDKAASEAGCQPLAAQVWEVALPGGGVAAIVRELGDAKAVTADGRKVSVYTLDEIAALIAGYPEIAKAKVVFPGATVTAVRRSVSDPLDNVHDTSLGLDDEIPW